MTVTRSVTPQGPFSLAASTRFLQGFTPAATTRGQVGGGVLRLAFPCEDGWATAGVAVSQAADPDGEVRVEVAGDADPEAVTAQVTRILSLDVDGRGFAQAAAADPVVGAVAARYPGLGPVLFASPFEAACWAVIGHRIRIVQGARIRAGIAARFGRQVTVAGVELPAFPDPATLASLPEIPGLPDVKTGRLRAIAQAALDGDLDAAVLRAVPAGQALARLRELPGIGPFSAELILVRGAGHPDVFPPGELRLHDSMADAYHLDHPDPDRLAAIAARWAPYRSWVSLLFRTDREEATGEVAGGRPLRPPSRSAPAPEGGKGGHR